MWETYEQQFWSTSSFVRMNRLLMQAGRAAARAVPGRAAGSCGSPSPLDWGIRHMDLTLDNVHLAEGPTVFDSTVGNVLASPPNRGVLRSPASFRGLAGRIPNSTPIQCSGRGQALRHSESSVIFGWWRGSSGWRNRPGRPAARRRSARHFDGWLDWEAAHLTA